MDEDKKHAPIEIWRESDWELRGTPMELQDGRIGIQVKAKIGWRNPWSWRVEIREVDITFEKPELLHDTTAKLHTPCEAHPGTIDKAHVVLNIAFDPKPGLLESMSPYLLKTEGMELKQPESTPGSRRWV